MDKVQPFLLLYVPCPTKDVAEKIAKNLIQKKLAGCVNIIEGMTSVYEWQGEIEQADEVVLLIKTLISQKKALELFIMQEHPYETPCIIHIDNASANDAYFEWISRTLDC